MKRCCLALIVLVVLVSVLPISAEDSYAPIQPFLNRYCVDCHGANKQKGEVRLDDYTSIGGSLWTNIFDQIHHGDMPPEDEAQPSVEELEQAETLIDKISRDDSFSIPTGYRRLNHREYGNTVRDLLGLRKGIYNPAARIYADKVDHGFDTNADKLVISNELLLEYLQSAEDSLRVALFLEEFEPLTTKVTKFNPTKSFVGDRRDRYTTRKKKSVVIRSDNIQHVKSPARKVPAAGVYRVTITAAGVDRDTYQFKIAPKTGPIKIGVGAQFGRADGVTALQLVETIELRDNKFETHQVDLWLEKGAWPVVKFLNGPKKIPPVLRQAVRQRKLKDMKGKYKGPGVEVTQFSLEGPLNPEWPPASYKATFLPDKIPDFEDPKVRDWLITRFVSRAFRRMATEIDVQDYREYLESQYQKSGNWQEAFIKTFAAVMSTHEFLYVKEEPGPLPAYELASRLSYFFWSSMPDPELFEQARTGAILETEVYKAQLKRLYSNPKTQEFVNSFVTQWLSLDVLGTMEPDAKDPIYGVYQRENYEKAFRAETNAFFQHVLFENRPVGDFLDSNYTFLNSTLARAYKIPFEGDKTLKRVALPEGSVRGGLLGQGSILSLTSNGVETLPVTRGHWVLDELLGMAPPPPPEAVPALVPDLTGADTPRAQLVRHREDATCFECHKQMDPIGLAMENFDVIGRFRAHYPSGTGKVRRKGPKIDPAGEMYGIKFANVAELRKILRSRESDFAKSLTIKLAEYAKGRKLNRNDLEIVDQVVSDAAADKYGFKSLLYGMLTSKLMLDR